MRRRLPKLLAFGFSLLIYLKASPIHALSVHAVYRSACERDVGVILRVEKREVHLLKLDGTVKKIPRHEIVSLLYYPVSQLPLSHRPEPRGFLPLRVETFYQGKVEELLTGWPIEYSENQISFLLLSGKELVVDRDSIWSLQWLKTRPAAATSLVPSQPLSFVHPQTSGFCANNESTAFSGARQIVAQQILNDQIVIRRELDRLLHGYEQVLEYERDQKYYPTPLVYKNRTMLGLWISAWSRYGASNTRSNNFTPILADELALGPFRYQHVLLSGATPNEILLHHEAQSQIFYRFKAAYFHTSVFFDPNLLLVGTRYSWRAEDVTDETLDDRMNEIMAIEFGFDWGPLSVQLYPAVMSQSLVKRGDFVDTSESHNLWRVGAELRFQRWRAAGYVGLASNLTEYQRKTDDADRDAITFAGDWQYRYARLGATWQMLSDLEISASSIVRELSYAGHSVFDDSIDEKYQSLSVSTALQITYALSHRFSVGGNFILEVQKRAAGDDTRVRGRPRIGFFTGFWF